MTLSRRRLLGAALAGTGSLAGCLGRGDANGPGGGDASDSETTVGEDTPGELRLARQGWPQTICQESINEETGILAVVDTVFDSDWEDYDVRSEYGTLHDDVAVIGLTDGDRARAYPVSVLSHHEIVNDEFGGPLLVTFCPLCNSGVVATRRVQGDPATFLVSGLLWRPPGLQTAIREERGDAFGVDEDSPDRDLRNTGNLVMYDDLTRSYWSQILATAICGPETGTELSIRPSSTATWGEWRRRHPDTTVLVPPPHSRTGGPN